MVGGIFFINQPISSTPVVGDTTHRLQQPTLVVGKIPPFSKEEKKKDPSEGTPSDPTSSWGNPSFKEGEEPPVGGNLPLTSKKEEKLPSWGEISSSFSKEERGDILHQLNHPPNLPVVGGHSSSTNPTPVVGTLFTNSNNPLVVGKSPFSKDKVGQRGGGGTSLTRPPSWGGTPLTHPPTPSTLRRGEILTSLPFSKKG